MKNFYNFLIGLLAAVVGISCFWLIGAGFIAGSGAYPLADYFWQSLVWLGFFVSILIGALVYSIYSLGRWIRKQYENREKNYTH